MQINTMTTPGRMMDPAIFTDGSKWALHPPCRSQLRLADKVSTFGDMPGDAQRQRVGRIAVVGLMGPLSLRGNYWGGTGTASFGRLFDSLVADRSVDGILIEIDSPGGTAPGTEELGSKIYTARDKKPIFAHVNGMMASAAFWIGSAATRVYASPSSEVGSVGVFAVHVDHSQFNHRAGFNVSYISAGRYKTEGNPDEPLSDDARQFIQADVDAVYARFVAALGRHRSKSRHLVATQFGEGRVLPAAMALRAGFSPSMRPLKNCGLPKRAVIRRPNRQILFQS